MDEFVFFIILITAIITLILINKLRIEIYSKKLLFFIVLFQILNYFSVLNFNLDILMVIFSFVYFVISNSKKIESIFLFSGNYTRKTGIVNFLIRVISSVILILLRYFELGIFFYYLCKVVIVTFSLDNFSRELITNFMQIQVLLIPFMMLFVVLYYIAGIDYKTLIVSLIGLMFLGLFEIKYWTVITILLSVLGLAFSTDFIKSFIKEDMFEESRVNFLRFIITYSTLLLYISIVTVKEIITINRIVLFFNFILRIQGNTVAEDSPIIMEYAFMGMLEILFFVILWWLMELVLVNLNIFNNSFFGEIKSVEDKARKLISFRFK